MSFLTLHAVDAPLGESFSGSADLARDLCQLDALLIAHLAHLRRRGRSALGEAVAGNVIEEGEAEGLLGELAAAHAAASHEPGMGCGFTVSTPGLRSVQQLAGLTPFEVGVLLLALAPEVDSRYGRIFAFLNDHAGQSRPTVGLAQAIMGRGVATLGSFLPDAPLLTFALLEVHREVPMASASLAVPAELWPRLVGLAALSDGPFPLAARGQEPTLHQLALSDEVRAEADAVARWFANNQQGMVVISGAEGSGRDALALAIAAQAAASALRVTTLELESSGGAARIRREALLAGAIPIVRLDSKDGWAGRLARLLGPISAPMILVCAAAIPEEVFCDLARPSAYIRLSLDQATRARVLERLLDGVRDPQIDVNGLVARIRLGPSQWRAAIRLAHERGPYRRGAGGQVGSAELSSAARALCDIRLGSLADRLPCPYEWSDLVVPEKTERELRLARSLGRHAVRLRERLGGAARLTATAGMACLFHGPPGTGKTLAAQVLARELELDLYRIDLSRVVDKYIGESEKNLARVFDAAEAGTIALFFDEADAMFGKRTVVSDAHDRYANLQTSYLLQRMENHPGVTILATNFRQNLDDAFMRRLQVVAEFPAPEVAERLRLWQLLLPPEEQRDAGVDVAFLAHSFALSGGHIRNAVLVGDALAAEEECTLGMKHLCLAVHRELTNAGRLVDPSTFGAFRAVVCGV